MGEYTENEIQKLSQDELKNLLKKVRGELAVKQQVIKEKSLPVIVLVSSPSLAVMSRNIWFLNSAVLFYLLQRYAEKWLQFHHHQY